MIGEERSEEATEAACVHNKNTMFRICPDEEMNLTYCVFCSLKIFCIDFFEMYSHLSFVRARLRRGRC